MVAFSKPKVDGLEIIVVAESPNRVDLLNEDILLRALEIVKEKGYTDYVVVESPIFTIHQDGSVSDFIAFDEEVKHQRRIKFVPIHYVHGAHSYMYGLEYVKGACHAESQDQ